MNADAFIGKPWREGATGPDAFDCWGLMVAASVTLFGVALPDLAQTVAGRRRWVEVTKLVPGTAVALIDMQGRPFHVGLYIGAGNVLHTTAQLGARIEPLRVFKCSAPAWKAYRWEG